MLGEEKLKEFTEKNYQKTLTKINDQIYHFLGYGHSNAIVIIGDTSVILVDTLDSDECAKDLKKDLETITTKPVQTIIYTHGHPDHRGGAGAFQDTVQEIIAFASMNPPLQYFDRIQDALNQRGAYQHGYGLTDDEAISQGIGIREGKERHHGKFDPLAPTTLYHEKCVERVIDGIKMKLVSAVGETDDQIYIWLEEDQVICTGDNYYGCWPNLYAIRGTPYRDIATWVNTLKDILSYDAVALLPGHTKPLLGRELIQNQVGTFKDAIEYVLLETLNCINKEMTLEETIEQVKLPEKYVSLDYLGEYYGTVEWSVKSIYNGYVGWFDGDATKLLPVSQKEYDQTLLELIGEEKLILKIKECMTQQQYQLALQLLDLIDYPELKKECLLQRAKQVTSANARHYLIASAKAL